MSSNATAPTGQAVIETVFRITGRGLVLMLAEHFQGTVTHNGRVETERGICPYFGPDIPRRTDGKRQVAVMVPDPRADAVFRPGDAVRFYAAG